MRIPSSGLRIDSPAFPLLQAHISYWGITSAAGNALGTTLVCADLANEPDYSGLAIKILDGGAAGQVRPIASDIAGTITVAAAFTNAAGAVQQIGAGTRFAILSIAGGGGAPPPPPPPPGVSLWMFGVCDPGMAASPNTLVLTNLAGFNDAIFTNEFWVQILHNATAPGTAPEREIRRVTNYVGATGTFTTDPFSANVMANDLVCVFHESIMSVEILGYGTLDFDSATVPADSARPGLYAWEVNNYFRGCLLMTTEGAARFAPRRIVEYTNATGVFTLDPNNPFPAAPGTVDYIIIGGQAEFVPAADGVNDRTPADVIGSKADTPIFLPDFAVSSIIRYLKGILSAKVKAYGIADAGSDVDTLVDAARAEANDYWNGMTLLMISGANAGLARRIYDYAVGSIEVRDAFPNAIVATDTYVILSDYEALLAAADSAENLLVRDVIGNKADTALTAYTATDSIMRYIKGILSSVAGTAGATMVGKAQIAATTIDLDLGIGSHDLFTGTTQVVILESLNIKLPTGAPGGTLTSISIQTDDATPGIIISAADGAVANLTTEADLGWTGTLYITVGTKIQLSILGGPSVADYVCNVTAKCRAVVAGGNLA